MNCKLCHRVIPDDSLFCCYCGKKVSKPGEKLQKHRRANGEGYIYKKGNSYTIVISEYINGERYRKTKGGFPTKTAASAYAAELKQQQSAQKAETIASLWQTYSSSAMLKLSDNKQRAYKKAFERIKSLATKDIQQVTIRDLQGIVDKLDTYYPAKDIKNLVSHLYKLAMAEQLVHVNLAEFITLPILEEREADFFNLEEISQLWKAYNGGDIFVGYILLMIYTGMMPAELRQLTVDMIDLNRRQIIGAGKKTKKRKITPIVIPDAIVELVQNLCEKSTDGKILPMNKEKFYDVFKPTLIRHGIRPLDAYACRHTTGTLSVGDITKKKELMRHSSITTTQRYTHTDSYDALGVANTIPKQ